MRRDIEDRKILRGVNVTYEIIGLNQDRLIEELKRRDFTLKNIKKISNRKMYITVNLQESNNFFAITKNLCYNIKKVKVFGKGLPFYKLFQSLGLGLGALVFLVACFLTNDLVLKVDYSGSGSVYARQVNDYLAQNGVQKFCRFSSFDTQKLEDDILANNDNLTFVSVNKRGNTLAVYMAIKNKQSAISVRKTQLNATVSGVVESIKVYRGSAVVAVGDSVQEGDLLVEGFAEIKGQRVETGVLAYITIITQSTYTYTLSGSGQEEFALAMAEEEDGGEIVGGAVTVKEVSGREDFIYTVSLKKRIVI